MAYHIYHSNSLKDFVINYPDLFHTESLFGEKVITVVQNKNIASWLRLQLAEKDGISMDLEVEFPENAVKKLVTAYPVGEQLFNKKSLLFMDSLKVVLYKTLEFRLKTPEHYPHLFEYVNGSNQRLFELSDSLAGLFYHYGMNCPEMVDSWDRGHHYVSDSGDILRREDQIWQMSLWRELFHEDTPYAHVSQILNKVLNSGESFSEELSPYGKCRIILFGSSFLGELAIKFFNYVSKDIDVHHFILTPSVIYSGEEYIEPKSLLNQFSGLINGFTELSRDIGFKKTRFNMFREEYDSTLLQQLQLAIRDNKLDDVKQEDPISVEGCESLKICRVTGGWREVEILADKILNLLDRDNTLKLTDIGVVAPDINNFAAYIEGVFSSEVINIPYNIVGLKGGEDSPFIRGFLSLLNLPGSDFNRRDIINIISNPCIMEKFSLSIGDRDQFVELIDRLNIKWAMDKEHRTQLGSGSDSYNTWEYGFRRVLLGIALNRGDNELIPVNLSDTQSVDKFGDLIQLLRSLYSDLFGLNSLKLYIEEWVMLIETIMETYLSPVNGDILDERERIAIKNQFRNMLNLLDDIDNLDHFENREIPFGVFKSLLKEFIIKAASQRGRYLTQGITFSSLKPLRAVPFKHLFVLGLNEDMFPGRESIPSYDLRGIYEQKIDLSKRQNDKFAFLELLLSAEKSLTLFYSHKNQITGEELQPSVVINELVEAIDSNFDYNYSLFEDHPLQSYNKTYFEEGSDLFSYNKVAYQSSRVYYETEKKPFVKELISEDRDEEVLRVDIKDLINFLKNPVKTFFNRGEMIYLDDPESIEDDIYENRDIDFLTKWKLANLVVDLSLNGEINREGLADQFFHTAEVEGIFREGRLGSHIKDQITELILGIDNMIEEKGLKNTAFKRNNLELGNEIILPEIISHGQRVLLTGEITDLWIDEGFNCFMTKLNMSGDKNIRVKDRLEAYITSTILFLAKDISVEKVSTYLVGVVERDEVEYKKSDNNQNNLQSLIDLYLDNLKKPVPLLPELLDKGDLDNLEETWEKLQNDDRSYNEISNSPYISFAYGDSVPNLSDDSIKNLYENIYIPLLGGGETDE